MRLGIRELIFVVLMLGLMGASYFFVFQPDAQKRMSLREETAKKKQELADLRAATAGIDDLERKIVELEEAIRFFEDKLPQQKELDKIVKEVWQKADRHQLQTKSIRTIKGAPSAGYSEQPIQMSLRGNFDGFYSFLLDLEKLPRITQTTQMKLDKVMTRDGEMEAQMTLNIFFESDGQD